MGKVVSITCATLALFVARPAAQDPDTTARSTMVPDEPLQIELTERDPMVPGLGRTKVFTCDLRPEPGTSTLIGFFQATSETLDLRVRVTAEDGKVFDNDGKQVENGWWFNPCVAFSTSVPVRCRIEVAARGAHTVGPVAIVCRLARETPTTDAVARAVKQRLDESATTYDKGDRQAALAAIDADLRLLDETPGCADSANVNQRRWELAFRRWRLSDTKFAQPLQQVWAFRTARYPYRSMPRLQIARFLGALLATRGSGRAINEEVLAAGRALDPSNPMILMAKSWLALEKLNSNEPADAATLYQEILAAQTALPAHHADVLQTKLELAAAWFAMRRLDASKELLQDVLAGLPAGHADTPRFQTSLAETLIEQSDLVAAKTLLEQVVAASRATTPRPAVAVRALRDLVVLKQRIGDGRGAAAIVQELVGVLNEDAVLSDRDAAITDALAATLIDLHQDEAARQLLETILIRERWRRPDDARMLLMKSRLATIRRRLGDEAGAAALSQEILAVAPKIDATSRRYFDAAVTLARVRFDAGDRAGAQTIWEAMLSTESGKEHCDPRLMPVILNLAALAADAGDADRFETLLLRYLTDCGVAVREAAVSLAPRELVSACEYASSGLMFGLGALQHLIEHAAMPDLLDLQSRSFILTESFRQAAVTGFRLQAATQQADAETQEHIAKARADAEAAQRDVTRALHSETTTKLDYLASIRERERATAALQSLLAALPGAEALQIETTVATIRAQLIPGQVVVAFWQYTPFAPGNEPSPPPRYCAWILPASGDLQWLPLDDVAATDEALAVWRAAIGDRDGAGCHRSGEALRRLVWDPIAARLDDAKVVHLAAYGDLHTLPWDVLPLADASLLGDHYSIHSHLTLRELAGGQPSEGQQQGRLVGVSAVSYGRAATARDPDGRGAGGEPVVRFRPLPHTAPELAAIAALHREVIPAAKQVLLSGPDASCSGLAAALPGANYVHLATHGFVLGLDGGAPAALEWRVEGSRSPGLRSVVAEMSPFALCGIALAGANDERAGERSVLSGDDIAALDLSQCGLFVLSCCDSAIGVRNTGAAVASLQTALHAAGARSVVTAMWSVPDEATQQLMSHFYRLLWQEGRSKHDALWLAKQQLRKARSEDGTPRFAIRDWAAWVLTGDPQ